MNPIIRSSNSFPIITFDCFIISLNRKKQKRRAPGQQTSLPALPRPPAPYIPTRYTDNYERYLSPTFGDAYYNAGYSELYANSAYGGTNPYSVRALMPPDGIYSSLQSLYNNPQVDRTPYVGYPDTIAIYRT